MKITKSTIEGIGGLISNAGNSTAIGGIAVTGTPSVGQEIVATSATTATWQTASSAITVKEIDGAPTVAATGIDVPNGSLSVVGTVATLAYVTPANGGLETITAHGNTGATETFFAAASGNVHTATLDTNCTFTFAAVTSGKACSFTMLLTQDATGGQLVTWPGSVVWSGGIAPVLATAAAAVDVLTFFTLDGGTVWYGFHAGAGASFATPAIVLGTAAAAGAATTVIRSDSTIVAFDATVPVTQAFGDAAGAGSVAVAARRDHKHGMPAAADVLALLPPAHAHVNTVTYSGDGSTTAFTLPAAPVDAYAAAAYVAGVRVDVSLSGTILDVMTFSTAPAAGTDNILVDIAAVLV